AFPGLAAVVDDVERASAAARDVRGFDRLSRYFRWGDRRNRMSTRTSALVVGGSLNGLTAALAPAPLRVPGGGRARHPNTSIQYKFRGIWPRSMEVCRSHGIEAEIRARDLIDDKSAYVARAKNLSDANVSWQGVPWADVSDIASTDAATCDQDQLEPILR